MQSIINSFAHHFIGYGQRAVIRQALRGEEGEHFATKLAEYAQRVDAMPRTYETRKENETAPYIAHLHYFVGGCDWYICEADIGDTGERGPLGPQHQAFGLADIYGDGGELGYISLPEILDCGAELDLYFEPRPLADIRKENA